MPLVYSVETAHASVSLMKSLYTGSNWHFSISELPFLYICPHTFTTNFQDKRNNEVSNVVLLSN